MKHLSTKTYGHERGLSCAFRQPNASHSHCSLLHGYALAFTFVFGCNELDDKNWVVDFGGLKDLKDWLESQFDHTVAVDLNDSMLDMLKQLEMWKLADVRIMDGVGCEKFAEHAFKFADELIKSKTNNRCWVESVEVKEHGANSAIYSL
mgnify:FL=1|jgi:6-pyruvoyltetrahydropterin/6-carboxytetrahydropterin synthase|tara:strand:+ start:622 stop:1068 length:447 start_codon:yes stop_codon:yes gene_type:complete